MKERLIEFLSNNKKKLIAFVVAGAVATFGITADQTTIDALVAFIAGLF